MPTAAAADVDPLPPSDCGGGGRSGSAADPDRRFPAPPPPPHPCSGLAVLIDVLDRAAAARASAAAPARPPRRGDDRDATRPRADAADPSCLRAWAAVLGDAVALLRLVLSHVQRRRQREEAGGRVPSLSLLSLIGERGDVFRSRFHSLLRCPESFLGVGVGVDEGGVDEDVCHHAEMLLEEISYDQEEEDEQR